MSILVIPDDLRRDVDVVSRISAVPTILRVVSEVTGLRFSMIARVTADHWVACAVHDQIDFGVKAGGTLDVRTTLCSEVHESREPIVINHATEDPIYRYHPTPKLYGFESYISVPIILGDGRYFGNVCALDPLPREVNQPKILEMMKLFGQLIGLQLAAEERQRSTDALLLDANQTAELREHFIAVLGHDLRNPITSVVMGADVLLREAAVGLQRTTLQRIRASGVRMTALVSDLLDFARSKLGAGMTLALSDTADLAAALRHVVAEIASAHPQREIRVVVDIPAPVRCDAARVSQLLSNLLANAVEHGAIDRPIEVSALRSTEGLRIAVRNEGPPIPPGVVPLLFRPYSRGGNGPARGLGLGLYIALEIARSHGGTLEVQSTADDGTRFTFTLPTS